MKISKELADVLREACKEVDRWPQWKRSLDPLGSKTDDSESNEAPMESKPKEGTRERRCA